MLTAETKEKKKKKKGERNEKVMCAYGSVSSSGNRTLGTAGTCPVQEGRAAERGSICKNGERIMTNFTTSVQILMHHLRGTRNIK